MEYRRLGKAGIQVSALSLGSWVTFGAQIGDDVAEDLMKTAYEAGVNFFDNAEAYASGKSEIVMGNILHKFGWPRSSFVVSSKVFWGGKLPNQSGLSRKHVFEACDAALKRLRVDHIDLYFCHRPDPNTPIEETVRAMHELILRGKILYWGTSEWSAPEIMEAYTLSREYGLTPPSMEQPQYNMLWRERFESEYKKLYSEIGMGTTIWSPLTSGMLTGKYNDGPPKDTRIDRPGMEWLKKDLTGESAKPNIARVKKLGIFAKELGTTLPKLAIAWCLKNPNVSTAILGASKTIQLKETLGSIEVLPLLSPEVMAKIEDILQNKPKMPVG